MGRECRRLVALRAISLLRGNGAAYNVKRTPAAQKTGNSPKISSPSTTPLAEAAMLRDDNGNGGGRPSTPRNVLGERLEVCSISPMTGFPRRCPSAGAVDQVSGTDRSLPPGVHRRDLDKDQHGAAARLGAARSTDQSQGATRPLKNHDFPGRSAPRPHHRSVVHR